MPERIKKLGTKLWKKGERTENVIYLSKRDYKMVAKHYAGKNAKCSKELR